MITQASTNSDPYQGTLCQVQTPFASFVRDVIVPARPFLGAGQIPAGLAPDLVLTQAVLPVVSDSSNNDLQTSLTDGRQVLVANIQSVCNTSEGSASNGLGVTVGDMISTNYKARVATKYLNALAQLNVPGLTVDVVRSGPTRVDVRIGYVWGSQNYSLTVPVNA